MKFQPLLKAAFILSTFALAPVSSFAAVSPYSAGTEKWEGSGASFSPDGKQVGTYTVSTVVTHPAPDVSQAETTIGLADGTVKKSSMTITSSGTSFSTDSNLGHGGGACYGAGICESYIDAGAARSYATTIIEDADGSRRSLTIVLEKGQAVTVLRDKVSLAK